MFNKTEKFIKKWCKALQKSNERTRELKAFIKFSLSDEVATGKFSFLHSFPILLFVPQIYGRIHRLPSWLRWSVIVPKWPTIPSTLRYNNTNWKLQTRSQWCASLQYVLHNWNLPAKLCHCRWSSAKSEQQQLQQKYPLGIVLQCERQ